MANPSNVRLTQLVDEFVSQLTVLIHQSALETVREALGEAPAKRRGPGRPRKAAKRRGRPRKATKQAATRRKAGATRGRRSAEQVAAMGKTVLAHVRSNPGQRLEEIGRALGVPTKGLKRPIANMLAAKQLRTEGQKRGTKYFAGRGAKRKA